MSLTMKYNKICENIYEKRYNITQTAFSCVNIAEKLYFPTTFKRSLQYRL
jgi:hypothetical protein